MRHFKFFFCLFMYWCCVTACSITINTSGSGDRCIKGSGNLITEERQVGAFTQVHASRGINVFIESGNSGYLRVESEDNLIQYIVTEVSGSTLYVKLQDGIKISSSKALNVYVCMDKIAGLTATSGADITGTGIFEADHIRMHATSAGDITMELSAQNIEVSATSGADIVLKGRADSLKGTVTSGADIKAGELVVRSCDISLTSGADAWVNVKETLAYSVTSGADLNCKGRPRIVQSHVSSGGDVRFD